MEYYVTELLRLSVVEPLFNLALVFTSLRRFVLPWTSVTPLLQIRLMYRTLICHFRNPLKGN